MGLSLKASAKVCLVPYLALAKEIFDQFMEGIFFNFITYANNNFALCNE